MIAEESDSVYASHAMPHSSNKQLIQAYDEINEDQ